MNFNPINTSEEYKQALINLEKLFDSKKGTKKGNNLEILVLQIEKFEQKHFPIL
jgi:HTH-type transcriptional regulator / antitoxin HigA